jgi:hypothetical protein
MEINMKLKKSDLKHIGGTKCEEEGTTIFCCTGNIANIEEIFLRNILEHLGYRITSAEDVTLNASSDFPDSTAYRTTLPWSEYSEITREL